MQFTRTRPAILTNNQRSPVRIRPSAPRRSKVRFAPTFFYSCGTKERHPPAPLLLLSKSQPLRWVVIWVGKRKYPDWSRLTGLRHSCGGDFSFSENSMSLRSIHAVFIGISQSLTVPLFHTAPGCILRFVLLQVWRHIVFRHSVFSAGGQKLSTKSQEK